MKSVTQTAPSAVVKTVSRKSGIAAIASLDLRTVCRRRNQPPPVGRRAEQGAETGSAVETRKTQPINGAVAAHQSERFAISNDCVVLDTIWHLRRSKRGERQDRRDQRASFGSSNLTHGVAIVDPKQTRKLAAFCWARLAQSPSMEANTGIRAIAKFATGTSVQLM